MKKVIQYEEIVKYSNHVWDETSMAFRNYLLSEAVNHCKEYKSIQYVDDDDAITLNLNVDYQRIDAASHIAKVTWYEIDDRFDLDLIIDDVKDIISFLYGFNPASRIQDLQELLSFLVDTQRNTENA